LSLQNVLLALCAAVVLWLAFKVAKVAFRVFKYVLLLGIAGFLVWYFLLRS
jgi:hypothetical protein